MQSVRSLNIGILFEDKSPDNIFNIFFNIG